MLCLSREVGERIVIGEKITVIINRVLGNRVTVGIEAPPEMNIRRSELPPRRDDDKRRDKRS